MGLFTKVILKIMRDMVLESKFGRMVRSIKGNGNTIKLMEKESFGMQMAIFMKACGKMIKLTGMEFTFI
mgnify:CR=1 FL=1